MLEVSQITRSYGNFKAVDNVSFSIGKGEIVGLLGHNGAGKTTILKMISGYLEPDNGSIHIDGISLADELKQVQTGLGYLPENLPVYAEMTVADYLDYAADLKGLLDKNKNDEIKRVIAATELSGRLLAPIATLSRGYRQRVGVAQAILGKPKLLILDEPTNGLDPEQTQHMRDLIRGIASDATVILSTHIMQEVDALCSRVLMLSAGSLAVDARLEALRHSNHLLLETSMPEAAAQALKTIEAIEDITLVETIAGDNVSFSYRIETQSPEAQRNASAELAAKIIQSGEKLYRLLPERRDLETLFREVNEQRYRQDSLQEGLSHAA
ncbi:MAG: ABC transporter ATP-binding protein [Gammaproteobacteria bacterium]|jgi:ABC-2 type transport system ATP-binding protein|nr:ABC transporter ATP-binding protein [Gammaproteobacteria bacterium]